MARRSRLGDRFAAARTEEVLGVEVPVAESRGLRLLGLAMLDRESAGNGLLIPRCHSVHTFAMRFDLDLVFLGPGSLPLCRIRAVPPGRLRWRRHATSVLELPSPPE